MKLTAALVLTLFPLCFISSAAHADESLGNVIGDTLRGEIRDSVVDSVRRDVCRRRAEENRDEDNRDEENRSADFCDTWQDLDRLGDTLRRSRNGIRAIEAIFD